MTHEQETPRTASRCNRRAIRLITFLILLGPALPSCRSNDTWSFSLSRNLACSDSPVFNFNEVCAGDNEAALAILAIALLPVLIDIVILPITLTHDICSQG